MKPETKVNRDEIAICLPYSIAPREPGEPLSDEIKNLVGVMVRLGYAPIDFGEPGIHYLELWFTKPKRKTTAMNEAERFIQRGLQ